MKKKNCKNDGVILITTLMIAIIGLLLIAILMQLISSGAFVSGSVARYTSALEAAKGGAEKTCFSIFQNYANDFKDASNNTFSCKAAWPTQLWSSKCSCSESCFTHESMDDIVNYSDWQDTLGNYKIYGKITSTNIVYPNPFSNKASIRLYTVDIAAINNSTNEKAWITVLYMIKKD